MNKNIIFDLDGVLSDFHFSFSAIANKLFGTPIITNLNQIKSWNWEDWGYFTKDQKNQVWKEIDKNIPDFWFNLRPTVSHETFSKIKLLEEQGNSIYFVTSRNKTAGDNVIRQTSKWIKKYIELEYFSIIPSIKKGKILNGLEANFFIDDSIENIIEVFHEYPNCKSYLLVREYNRFAIEFIQKSHKYRKIGLVYTVNEFIDTINNE